MFQIPLATSSNSISTANFWEALLIYHQRPNLINRKLLGIKQVLFYEIFNVKDFKQLKEAFTRASILYEYRKSNQNEITIKFLQNILETYDKNVTLIEKSLIEFKSALEGIFISVRLLLPRSNSDKCVEIVLLNKKDNLVTFVAAQEERVQLAPKFPYDIELSLDGNLRILVNNFEDADTGSGEWLADKLFTKLLKWSEEEILDEEIIQSLRLISIENYCDLYQNLKEKYATNLIKIWPENANTDPQKYIFEDLAIAAYLICLWQKYSNIKPINFVDCGCGNGLLVYILNQEGYNGYGVDLRKRKIWNGFPHEVDLRAASVIPSSTFPESTWIIGNHSDELTPWIPVIASKSSPDTNFFLLPCCPYDFKGHKYIRTNSKVSQYTDYLNYIKNICIKCNFQIEIDKLRIPSTKRTCLIGIRNENSSIEYANSCLIEHEDFKMRNSVEKVRNCTQLNRDLITRILNLIVKKLLDIKNYDSNCNWNKGGTCSLSELCKEIPKNDLVQLKNECGGLQTLLRNHRYIFKVDKGSVMLREPLVLNDETKKYRNKPCWFQKNHPDGCLYDSQTCAYQHC